MRIKTSRKPDGATGGEGKFRVRLHSRRAALVKEFCLDAKANELEDLEAAEEFLRRTLVPCDFAETTVTLTSDEGSESQETVQFALKSA